MIEKQKDHSLWKDGVFIGSEYPNPALIMDIYTVRDMKSPAALEQLESILDSSKIVKAKKIDERDPPRRKKHSLEEC